MADDADRAAELQEIANSDAIREHARRPAAERRAFCIDCNEIIPHRRRALGVSRCIECQEAHELRWRRQ